MAKEEYVEASQVLASLPPNGLVKVYVPNSNEGGAFYDSQEFYIVAGNSLPNSGVWTPTVSDLVNNPTVLIGELLYKETDGIVTFGGAVRVNLDGGQTTGNFKIDLPSEIQPTNNWSNQTDVNVVLNRTNGLFTEEVYLVADGGSKLIQGGFSDTTAGAVFKVAISGWYNKNN